MNDSSDIKKENVPPAEENTSQFETLVLSLATSALLHLGESKEDPSNELNLPLAKQSIELLGMLHEKTRGNLTSHEQILLETILYDLRLKFIEKTSGQSAQ